MITFTKIVFSICKNEMNLSKRTLFSRKSLYLEGFQKLRLNFEVKKSDSDFLYEIKHSPIPKLLISTKLWTLRATRNDEHIDLLRHSLNRIYENFSTIVEREEINDLNKLGPMTMRLFHHLDSPEKALQVNIWTYFTLIYSNMCTTIVCIVDVIIRLQFYHEFNNSFFDSKTTSYILMDLLFEHKKYNELLDIYQIRTHERQFKATPLHRLIVYAACYKMVCETIYIKKIWRKKIKKSKFCSYFVCRIHQRLLNMLSNCGMIRLAN